MPSLTRLQWNLALKYLENIGVVVPKSDVHDLALVISNKLYSEMLDPHKRRHPAQAHSLQLHVELGVCVISLLYSVPLFTK